MYDRARLVVLTAFLGRLGHCGVECLFLVVILGSLQLLGEARSHFIKFSPFGFQFFGWIELFV